MNDNSFYNKQQMGKLLMQDHNRMMERELRNARSATGGSLSSMREGEHMPSMGYNY